MSTPSDTSPTAPVGLEAVVEAWADVAEVRDLARRIGSTAPSTARVADAVVAPVVAALHRLRAGEPRPGLVVLVDDDDAARDLADLVADYRPDADVAYLPRRGVDWGSPLLPSPHLVGERAHALAALAAGGIVAVSAAALVERIPPRDRRARPLRVALGDRIERDDLLRELVRAGYERVGGRVEERGQVSVRGDVVDVFPTTGREPLRIELFGDEVERLSAFSALTQRSLRDVSELVVQPAREELDAVAPGLLADEEEHGGHLVPHDLVPLAPELLAAGALLVHRPRDVIAEAREHLEDVRLPAAARGRAYARIADVEDLIAGAHRLDPLPGGQPIQIEGQPPAFAARGLAETETELRALARRGLRVVISFPHRGEAERQALALKRVETTLLEPGQPLPKGGGVLLAVSGLRRGFVASQAGVAVLPSTVVFRRRAPGAEAVRGKAIRSFADLRPGDYVVHEDHGIGRFTGFDVKTVAGVTRDYLDIQFKGEDRLFLPHEQIAKLSRYIGADARPPVLSKLGGKAWLTMKARARSAVREMAGELLALYAARQALPGHAYPEDDELMRRLEGAFPYDETDDQARAIEAVKEDLESDRPMDRLICGDVGFGKTEVAMRAAMKVVSGGRQVLVLAPTTILAQQHFATFRDRFRDEPVRVEVVSRFRKGAETTGALADWAAGKVDILIGTHRVLSRDVVPHDLGLVIIDEEQRFGVAQKELLRQLRTEVDVLALSATPIPRTLHMSLAGLRDISVIATPPRGRRPIRTHVGEYDEELIALALRREIERGGQAFYLHNRVESIDETAAKLRQLCPELRFAVGHGQMTEVALEKVMAGFLVGDADVLVATTIIESGLDIPTANTLIVERADLLGLSQLYQIRGRVGRSAVHASAYLLYPDDEELSTEARARLAALADYTELGSGFKVAMRDLELRGAGNLLGDEQSGHVAAVGFELYCELLAEAVAEVQGLGRAEAPLPVVRIDAAIDHFVPAAYVGFEAAKMEAHRAIGMAASLEELRDAEAGLVDRFGPLPEPVENLVGLREARLRLQRLAPVALAVQRGRVALSGISLSSDEQRALQRQDPKATYVAAKREVGRRVDDGARAIRVALDLVHAVLLVRGG